MGSRASCSGPAVYTLTRAVLPAVYQKFNPDLAQWGVVSDHQNSKHMSIGMTTRIFHAESEGYISAEGDSYQSGGKRLVVHKDIAVAHGGARNRNSNRLFCVTNPDLSRRHIGGQVRNTSEVGPEVGPTPAFPAVFSQECMGQLASFGPT